MHTEINLEDLLHLLSYFPNDRIKIKFNQYNGEFDPMDLYKRDPEKVNTDWLLWRTQKRYFYENEIAICLLKLSYDIWLLTTVKRITKDYNIKDGVSYEAEEIGILKQFYGRTIIKYHKYHQTQLRLYNDIYKDLVVSQLLPTSYDGEDFPGYDKVRLTFQQLETIIFRNKRDWIIALENQKAVYLITDTKTGKLYVGSATANNGMLLSRWKNYISNGHGGNVELIKLVEEKGFDYIKDNFQYAILENYNGRVDDGIILERESWWKETLKTRDFGYNIN